MVGLLAGSVDRLVNKYVRKTADLVTVNLVPPDFPLDPEHHYAPPTNLRMGSADNCDTQLPTNKMKMPLLPMPAHLQM